MLHWTRFEAWPTYLLLWSLRYNCEEILSNISRPTRVLKVSPAAALMTGLVEGFGIHTQGGGRRTNGPGIALTGVGYLAFPICRHDSGPNNARIFFFISRTLKILVSSKSKKKYCYSFIFKYTTIYIYIYFGKFLFFPPPIY